MGGVSTLDLLRRKRLFPLPDVPGHSQKIQLKGGSQMKRFSVHACTLLCLAAGSLPCIAQANSWNGSWKVDPSSIKFEGTKFTVTPEADGYSVKMGSDAPSKTVCDGKSNASPAPAPEGTSYTCTKTAAGYHIETSRGGKTIRKADLSVSSDGKKMIRKSEMFPATGDPYTMTVNAKRLSGSTGMAGEWQQVDIQESQETGVLTIAVEGDTVAFKESDTPKPIQCKLDGTEVNLDETSTISVKLVDPKTLKVTYRADGKVRRENTFVLSDDGKSIQETDLTPEPAVSTTSMVFHKA